MTRWRRPESGLTTRLVEDTAFVHVEGVTAVAILNETAVAVWHHAADAANLPDLVARVSSERGVPAYLVRDDVARTVAELVSAGLLRESA